MGNCQLWPQEQGVLITLDSPLVNPVASLAWYNKHQKEHVFFAVRLPVKRGAIIEHGGKLPVWQDLPLTADADFLTNTREGEILLELTDRLPHKEPWIKATGDRPLQLGKLLGRRIRIPIHRLRDYLGFRFLTLYIETEAGWLSFLNQGEEVQLVESPPVRQELIQLVGALWQADQSSLWQAWQQAKKAFGSSDTEMTPQALFLGPHLGDWDGLQEILKSDQIIEIGILRLRSHLRQPDLNHQDLNNLKSQIDALPPDSYRKHAEGEWWYRLARNHWTQAPGALDTAYQLLNLGSWGDPVTATEAYSLVAMVALLGSGEMPEEPLEVHSTYVYSQLFQECSRFMKTAWKIGSDAVLPEIPEPLIVILAPQDALFLKACHCLMRHVTDQASIYIAQLSPYVHTFPAYWNLLQARMHRMMGEHDRALVVYRGIIERLPFVLDEMYS